MIRKILKEDIETINNLGNIFMNNFSVTYNLSDYIDNDNYILYLYELEEIIGFLISVNNVDCVELEFIFVKEEYRNNKIGYKLLSELFKYKKDIILEVSSNNESAIKFYKKIGFENIYTRKNYYSDKSDAIIMKLVNNE